MGPLVTPPDLQPAYLSREPLTPVGYPMVSARDIENGKIRAIRELFGATKIGSAGVHVGHTEDDVASPCARASQLSVVIVQK